MKIMARDFSPLKHSSVRQAELDLVRNDLKEVIGKVSETWNGTLGPRRDMILSVMQGGPKNSFNRTKGKPQKSKKMARVSIDLSIDSKEKANERTNEPRVSIDLGKSSGTDGKVHEIVKLGSIYARTGF